MGTDDSVKERVLRAAQVLLWARQELSDAARTVIMDALASSEVPEDADPVLLATQIAEWARGPMSWIARTPPAWVIWPPPCAAPEPRPPTQARAPAPEPVRVQAPPLSMAETPGAWPETGWNRVVPLGHRSSWLQWIQYHPTYRLLAVCAGRAERAWVRVYDNVDPETPLSIESNPGSASTVYNSSVRRKQPARLVWPAPRP